MNDQALGVAQVRQVREDLHVVDQLAPRCRAALDAERQDRPLPLRQILLRDVVVGARFQSRVLHPRDRRLPSQPLGHRHGVAAVRLHAEFERLDSLNEEERVERADAGSEIAQTLHARLNDVGQRPEHLGELHAVISRARLRDRRVLVGPCELAAIDDDAADGGAVPAQELGGRLDHDIGAVLDRPAQVRRRHRIVDHQRHAGLVRDLRHRLDVEHVHARIGDGFAVQGTRLRGDRLAEVFRVVGLDEFDVDAQTPEAHVELRVGAAVERAGRHQFIALPEQAGDRQELRRLSARCRETGDAALQRRHALLEDVRGRIHDAGIDVAELLQAKERRRMVGVLEGEGSRLVDGYRARSACRIRRVAGMQGLGGEPEFAGGSVVISHLYRIPCPARFEVER